ncbi:hypothetical protein BDY17DRAFT_201842 [Neohortaea acidophila]|uniref:Uncharacterized protein n=1 Tax=Neohortaea acidophila TaxID=245834 RepID=A0A6A6PLL1_9PEZI|nr:uncharacterized protein BDY17DRAFT_201842 [Neohortaea acidophila]KAF2480872.1 hypothetical protein BDY17DRAFT_201842 [Neohortaea acidophila]
MRCDAMRCKAQQKKRRPDALNPSNSFANAHNPGGKDLPAPHLCGTAGEMPPSHPRRRTVPSQAPIPGAPTTFHPPRRPSLHLRRGGEPCRQGAQGSCPGRRRRRRAEQLRKSGRILLRRPLLLRLLPGLPRHQQLLLGDAELGGLPPLLLLLRVLLRLLLLLLLRRHGRISAGDDRLGQGRGVLPRQIVIARGPGKVRGGGGGVGIQALQPEIHPDVLIVIHQGVELLRRHQIGLRGRRHRTRRFAQIHLPHPHTKQGIRGRRQQTLRFAHSSQLLTEKGIHGRRHGILRFTREFLLFRIALEDDGIRGRRAHSRRARLDWQRAGGREDGGDGGRGAERGQAGKGWRQSGRGGKGGGGGGRGHSHRARLDWQRGGSGRVDRQEDLVRDSGLREPVLPGLLVGLEGLDADRAGRSPGLRPAREDGQGRQGLGVGPLRHAEIRRDGQTAALVSPGVGLLLQRHRPRHLPLLLGVRAVARTPAPEIQVTVELKGVREAFGAEGAHGLAEPPGPEVVLAALWKASVGKQGDEKEGKALTMWPRMEASSANTRSLQPYRQRKACVTPLRSRSACFPDRGGPAWATGAGAGAARGAGARAAARTFSGTNVSAKNVEKGKRASLVASGNAEKRRFRQGNGGGNLRICPWAGPARGAVSVGRRQPQTSLGGTRQPHGPSSTMRCAIWPSRAGWKTYELAPVVPPSIALPVPRSGSQCLQCDVSTLEAASIRLRWLHLRAVPPHGGGAEERAVAQGATAGGGGEEMPRGRAEAGVRRGRGGSAIPW